MTGAPRWGADLALAAVALIWGSTFVLVKQALDDVSTLLFLSLRFSLATAALLLFFRGRLGNLPERKREIRGGLWAGLFLFVSYFLQTFGLRFTTPSKSAFVTGLYIVLVPLLAAAVYRRAPQLSEWLGVAAATAGMALLTLDDFRLKMAYGDLLTLGCAVGFAIHILLVGRYARPGGYRVLGLVQIAAAAGFSTLAFPLLESPRIEWNAGVLATLAVTGILATALAFTVQAWAQQHTTPTRTALIFALEPVFAWMTSFLVTGEILTAGPTLGAVLILAGILLVELKPIRVSEHPSRQLDRLDPL
jgi:drug/metabolite transporter (DMT)-like permease